MVRKRSSSRTLWLYWAWILMRDPQSKSINLLNHSTCLIQLWMIPGTCRSGRIFILLLLCSILQCPTPVWSPLSSQTFQAARSKNGHRSCIDLREWKDALKCYLWSCASVKYELLSVGHKTGQHTSPGMMGKLHICSCIVGMFCSTEFKEYFFLFRYVHWTFKFCRV